MRLEKGWGEVGEMGRVGRKGGKDVGINGEEGVDIKGRLRDGVLFIYFPQHLSTKPLGK